MEKDFSPVDIKTLRRLTSILNGGELTQKEFVSAFEQVVQIVLNIETKLVNDNKSERADMQAEAAQAKQDMKDDFAGHKDTAMALITKMMAKMKNDMQAQIDKMDADMTKMMSDCMSNDEKMDADIRASIPTVDDIFSYLPTSGAPIRDALEMLQGDDRLDISAVKGFDKLQADIMDAQKKGTPITFRGGARGIYVYIGGVKKGIMNMLNFAAGTGMAIAYSKVNGLDTITFDASASGGITVETPPEPANAVTAIFTVTAKPKWIVSDGTTYYEGAGYSYAALAVTLNVAPSSFIRAII